MPTKEQLAENKALGIILQENFSPVARMRLLSEGIQPNNRFYQHEQPTADKGCLACGCCVDACPVVREKESYVFPQNRRTSMSLENIVGEDCRRCYKCVRACPQVSKDTKEYVLGFRRVEKFIHATMATAIFSLMSTGIFLYHYRDALDKAGEGWQNCIFSFIHIIAGILLVCVPFLFWKLGKATLKRTLQRAWAKDEADKTWWANFREWLCHPVGKQLPEWREFNPYHKLWIRWLSIAIPALTLTGICNFIGAPVDPNSAWAVFYPIFYAIHSLVALCTDLLVLTHLYFKLLRWIIRMICNMYKRFRANGKFDYPYLYDRREQH